MYSVYYRLAQHGTPYIGQGQYEPERWVNIDQNKKMVKQLNKKAVILENYTHETNPAITYPLKYVKNAYNNRDVIYLDIDGIAEFSVELETEQFPLMPTMCQVSIVRNVAIVSIEKLTKHVFWTYIFPRYNAVITDGTHFPPVIPFYNKRINEAWEKGYHVYFIDLKKKKKPIRFEIPKGHLYEYVNKIWGDDFYHFVDIRVLITKDKLL